MECFAASGATFCKLRIQSWPHRGGRRAQIGCLDQKKEREYFEALLKMCLKCMCPKEAGRGGNMTKNLIEGIQDECNRCRELLEAYAAIGPAGQFGSIVIRAAIKEGEAAIASNDVVRCVAAYKSLQDCQ